MNNTSVVEQITPITLRESDRGRWVEYRPSEEELARLRWPPFFREPRRGRILRWTRHRPPRVYVVFACPEWDHYQDYLACPVNPKFLLFVET
jgi:hypothetical protein